ncbi:protein FAM131C [Pseudoliparis swirei]|uniref:protein FAM131C n=1 Tax=Pseudoliparis swirei TaxID=2059687 RepID=UPI0024BE45CE|nr:protein FAM131C [Pseudoliparis swirei]
MGACLCKGHKELHHPMKARQDQTEEVRLSSVKDGQNPSNGSVSDESNGYDIGELATSSLMGLVATIKEHITKPTAMAQGRVAHLIEWKGWGGGGVGGEAGGGGGRGGWGGMGLELHEDEQFYSQMTDEIKEARFAAGVAEQFALAEASMNAWSLDDRLEPPSTSLHAAQNHFLSQFLLDGGSVSVPQHLYSIHAQMYGDSRPAHPACPPVRTVSPTTYGGRQDRGRPLEAAVRHGDSSSLSEDDVFYN